MCLLVMIVLDVSFQNLRVINDLSALRAGVVTAAVIVDQVFLVVLRLHKLAAKLANLSI
jgi:hypothetical protein